MASLITGAFDEATCEVCSHRLKVRNHLILTERNPNVATVLFGWLAEGREQEFLAALRRGLMADHDLEWEVRAAMSIEEMKAGAADLVKRKLKPIALAQKAELEGKLPEHLQENWTELTAEAFSAGRVVLAVHVPGVTVVAFGKDPATVSADDAIQLLGHLQARTWIALWIAWTAQKGHPGTLEADLKRHIHPGSLVNGAAEEALGMLEKLSSNNLNLSFHSRYCMEALRASLHSAAEIENSHAKDWAKLFLECELIDEEKLIVSAERAKDTVTFEALWDAILAVTEGRFEWLMDTKIDAICEKAGHPQLLSQLPKAMEVRFGEMDPVEVAVDLVCRASEKVGKLVEAPDALVQPLVDAGDAKGLERVAEAISAQIPGDRVAEATADAWLGAKLKLIQRPARYLNRIGTAPRDWENDLPRRLRTRLWLERSNHLRLLGRTEEALAVLEQAIETGGDAVEPESARILRRNRAILLRETGAPDAAVEILMELREGAKGAERIEVLESLAISQAILGDYASSRQTLEEAMRFAKGPFAKAKPKLVAAAAALAGRDGSIEALLRLEEGTKTDAAALIALGAAWANTLRSVDTMSREALTEITEVLKGLKNLVEQALEQGAYLMAYSGLRALAPLADRIGAAERALEAWTMAYDLADEEGLPHDPNVTLALAEAGYRKGDLEFARHMLVSTAGATEASFGGLADLSKALAGSERIEYDLQSVATLILDRRHEFADVRLIGEMQRDTLARSRNLRSQTAPVEVIEQFTNGISDEIVARLAPAEGRVGVVEWIEARDYLSALMTVIDSDGGVKAEFLPAIAVDLKKTGVSLTWRLSTWTRKRNGEPFDIEEWSEVKSWLGKVAGAHLKDGDHLVFLEHESASGIAWHVAAADRWTCSYAPGWLSLLSRPESPERRGPIGIAAVPLATDSQEVRFALERSVERTRRFAGECGTDVRLESGASCDRQRVSELLGESGLAKVLCHGFVQPKSYEVAWLVGDGRALPSAKAVELGRRQGAAHLLSWRDAAKLDRSADVVFSAACSSGQSHLAGVGERIGLMAGLRTGGTRALVAPRWDIVAGDVLPILDDALERYWRSGKLAQAVANACRSASDGTPDWVRWAIAVEGDWR